MSTVQDLGVCRQCREESAVTLFNTRTSEEHILCAYCGYTIDIHLERDEDGSLVKNEEGKYILNADTLGGFGVAKYHGERGGTLVTLDDNSEETIQLHLEQINSPTVDKESSYLTVYRDGELEFIIGNKEEVLYT